MSAFLSSIILEACRRWSFQGRFHYTEIGYTLIVFVEKIRKNRESKKSLLP
jgi:hypothetical protein